VVAFSNQRQDGNDDPIEVMFLPDSTKPLRLAVLKVKGADRYFQLTAFGSRFIKDGRLKAYASPGDIRGHATVPAAFSVAAVPAHGPLPFALAPGDPANPAGPFPGRYTKLQKMEPFTSDGPRRTFFTAGGRPLTPGNFTATGGQLRTDPDFAAADGVRTSLSEFDPFFGTSASAAHAGAIAALALSGRPDLTAQQFRSAVQKTSLDIEGRGRDRDTGSGIVMAEPLLAAVGARSQPYVAAGRPVVTSTTDGDAFLEPGERGVVSVTLTNTGSARAGTVSATLASSTPGVTVTPAQKSYGALDPGARRARTFAVTADRQRAVGSKVRLTLVARSTGRFSPQTRSASLVIGEPSPTTKNVVYAGPTKAIPDGGAAGATVAIPVKAVGPVSRVAFSVDGTRCSTTAGSTTVGLDHPFTADLVGTLTSPDGTKVQLFANIGVDANNFCKTVFDDGAKRPITGAEPSDAPYSGPWRPAKPLSAFRGRSGNGTWKFTVVDDTSGDKGTLRKVSLHLNGYRPASK